MKKLIIIPYLFISLILSATNYYVKNGGNDGAAGTSDGTANFSATIRGLVKSDAEVTTYSQSVVLDDSGNVIVDDSGNVIIEQ